MAEFSVLEQEGVRYVRIGLNDDSVRIEAGALCLYRGRITMDASIPSVGTMFSASLSAERAVRPVLTGTGEIELEASVGGFHILDLQGEEWIIESGAYWASDDEIAVGAYRERMMNSFWAGDGLIDFCTRVRGRGKVVLTARGPTEEVTLAEGESYAAETKGAVIARTADVRYRVRRPSRSLLGSWLSGERSLKVYTGPGRIVIAPTPYWRAFLLEKLGTRPEAANAGRPPARPTEKDTAGAA